MKKYGRRKVSIDHEKNIAIGCIISTKFARDFNLLIGKDLDLLKSKYIRIIISWALEYYKTYNEAPTTSILDIFKAEKENLQSEEDKELIEDTLDEINNKYVEEELKFDAAYIYSQVEIYIRGRALENSADQIKGFVKQNKMDEAEKIISEYRKPCKGELSGIQLLEDMNSIQDMFVEQYSVFHPPGDLGILMGDMLKGDLCYIGGSSKSSKTWTSMELAMMCLREGLNVGWFTLEMNSLLMAKRFAQNMGNASFKELQERVYVPYFDEENRIYYKKEKIKQLNERGVKRNYKLFKKQYGGRLVIYDATTSGNTVASVKNTLINAEELEGIKFDVIFIDQLNLLKTFNKGEKRHQLDAIALDIKRDIAQELNMLVFSPLQYNRLALKQDTNDESSISEAYSLYSHASLLISLNQTKEEREKGLLRITCSGRNDKYSGVCLVLQCLDKGRAVLDSKWLKSVPNYDEIICNTEFGEEDEIELEDI
jgi:hypothetical protein